MLLNLFSYKTLGRLSDQELIQLFKDHANKQAKKQRILGEIYNRYAGLMYGVNLKYLQQKEEAEDVLMNTFETLGDKLERHQIQNLKNWLYTMTKNACLMRLRKKNVLTPTLENQLIYQADDSDELLNEALIGNQKIEALESAINQLKPEQKTCIHAFYLLNQTYEEVSDNTGFDLKKVKSYIQNGKRNLKILLENEAVFQHK